MPSVDVESGAITPSTASIEVDSEFTWTCNNSGLPNGTHITVSAHAVGGHPWFETSTNGSSISFTTPNASAAVTAKVEGDDCTWSASGVNVNAGAHVKVVSTMLKAG